MDRTLLHKLFKKLAEDNITSQEYEQLMDYLTSHELDEADIPDDVVPKDELVLSDATVGEALSQVLQRAGVTNSKNVWRSWGHVATASIAASLVIGMILFLIPARQEHHPTESQTTFLVKGAPPGSRDSLTLSDGSRIWLNSGSSVSYPTDFNSDGPRLITLQGEAFFDVAPLEGKPFVVQTGKVRTTVLGTGFNVNAFGPDRLDVTVVHGKVRVDEDQRNLAVLTMNQKVSYHVSSHTANISTVDAHDAIAWMDDRLVFRDVRVGYAIEVLSRQFDVTFNFSDPALANCIFSASFGPGESLDTVLNVICLANGMNHVREGNTIILRGVGCP